MQTIPLDCCLCDRKGFILLQIIGWLIAVPKYVNLEKYSVISAASKLMTENGNENERVIVLHGCATFAACLDVQILA